MAKTEKLFPLSTTGGRIQHLRREKGIRRNEFYDLVYKDGSANDINAKNKTVLNWESGNSQSFTSDVLKRMCEILNCDADYLLCIQDQPRKEYTHITKMTGLSYKAVERMTNNSDIPPVLSSMLETGLIYTILSAAKSHYEDGYIENFKGGRLRVSAESLYNAEKGAVYISLMDFINKIRKQGGLPTL